MLKAIESSPFMAELLNELLPGLLYTESVRHPSFDMLHELPPLGVLSVDHCLGELHSTARDTPSKCIQS